MTRLLLLAMMLPVVHLAAQPPEKNTYQVTYCKDPKTGVESAQGNKRLTCATDSNKGFWLTINWEVRNGEVVYAGLSMASKGLGACHENDLLLLTFEDQTTTTLRSWTGMDCEGKASFDYTRKSLDEISAKKLVSLKLSNGMSTDTYSCTLPAAAQTFFIEANAARTHKNFKQINCPK